MLIWPGGAGLLACAPWVTGDQLSLAMAMTSQKVATTSCFLHLSPQGHASMAGCMTCRRGLQLPCRWPALASSGRSTWS